MRNIAQIRDGEHRAADEVLEIDRCAVGRVVRVSLRVEMLVFRIDGDHAVCDDIQVLIEHKGDRVTDLHVLGRTGLDIDQRAGVIRRLHAAGQDAHRPQTDQPHAHQKQRQNDNQDHQHGGDSVPHLLNSL